MPIKRILYQVELEMQEAVSNFMPEVADVMATELERTLDNHEILNRLERASYGQAYTYTLPSTTDAALDLESAYDELVRRVGDNFRHICRQATMYELVKPARSIHTRLRESEEQLALPDNDRVLDAILNGAESVRREWQQAAGQRPESPATTETDSDELATEEEIAINILDEPVETTGDVEISFPGEDGQPQPPARDLETSYAEKLDNVAVKTNRIFKEIVDDLFSDDDLLPRLRRLFWLEATKSERDFNNHIVKPMLRQHDRKLHDEELREALAGDLESISDLEELMRVWEGLHKLETNLPA